MTNERRKTEFRGVFSSMPELREPIRRRLAADRAAKRSQFDLLVPRPGGVVFLGDSITEGGMWSEWFPEITTYNRGIGGDTIDGLAARLERAINDPQVVSVLIGTNDLVEFDEVGDPADIADRAAKLFGWLRELAPSARILVNAVMPRTAELAPAIGTMNARYRATADEIGADYVDTWPALADDTGALRADLTHDALHLNGAGYRVWVDLLRSYIGRERSVSVMSSERES